MKIEKIMSLIEDYKKKYPSHPAFSGDILSMRLDREPLTGFSNRGNGSGMGTCLAICFIGPDKEKMYLGWPSLVDDEFMEMEVEA